MKVDGSIFSCRGYARVIDLRQRVLAGCACIGGSSANVVIGNARANCYFARCRHVADNRSPLSPVQSSYAEMIYVSYTACLRNCIVAVLVNDGFRIAAAPVDNDRAADGCLR